MNMNFVLRQLKSTSELLKEKESLPGGWIWHTFRQFRQGSAELDISERPKKFFATARK